jgi:PAS domain S-box-containing protein
MELANPNDLVNRLFAGESTMSMAMRSHDWPKTALGSVEQWPQSLRTTICIMLNSPLPMFVVWGKEQTILYNDACCIHFDLPNPAQGVGRPGKEVFPETWKAIAELVNQTITMEQATSPAHATLITQPYPPPLQLSCCPIWDDTGAVGGVVCTSPEPCPPGKLCQSLSASENQESGTDDTTQLQTLKPMCPFPRTLADVEVESIYQSAPIGLNVLDRDLRFVRVNQRLAEINGFPVEAHIGRTVRELLPNLADIAEEMLRPVLEIGEPLMNVEITGETPAMPGVQRTWLESFLPLKNGDRVIGISTVCEEITERKRIEAARQEAESALRQAKDELEQRVLERTTELRQMNANLRESEVQLRRYERIIATTTDGICLVNRDGVYVIANQTYLNWHQKTADEVIGHSIKEILGETLFEQNILPYLKQCLAGETLQFEWWIDYPEVGPQFISISYIPYMEVDNTISGVIVALRNLTKLQETEQALRESELRFRGIFDQTFQFIGLLSPDGTLLEANQTVLDFGGIQREDVIGHPFWEATWWTIAPETQAQLRQAIAHAAQGEFVRYEVDVKGSQNQVITIDFSLRPVFDETGAVVLLIPEGRDISERKLAQKQLELQAVITRNMAEGICLVRADNGIIVYANPKFEQMFGYNANELTGKHVSIVNYPTEEMSPEAVNQAIRTAVLANQEATYEVRNVKKDGTPFWCSATTSVFEHPDYGTVLVAVQQDIDDRKQVEAQRKQAEAQLRASLKEKELLLKEIYHRVKNNLQVIYSLLNLQSRYLQDPKALEVLKDSQSRIRAMALVHEKLYQSRNLSQIDLRDYITSLAHSLLESYRTQRDSPALNLELEQGWLNIETAIPCGLILTELLSNSLKHAFPDQKSGEILISSTLSSDQKIILTICDNGIGLPPGFNLKTVSSLGLQLVRNLTQQIKGQVTINPTSQGTEFQLVFPLSPEQPS